MHYVKKPVMVDLRSHEGTKLRDCPLCGNRDLETLRGRDDPTLLRCHSCSLLFRDRPVQAVVDHRLSPDELDHLARARERLFTGGLRDFEALRETNRLLDVGCGGGHFAAMAAASWNVLALEPEAYLCSVAHQRGLMTVLQATAENLPAQAETFDVVTLWDVLDHLEQPISALREAHRVLRPGGLVRLRVRNGRLHYRMRRTALIPNRLSVLHNILFSPANLHAALRFAGFTEVRTGVAPLTRGNPYRKSGGPRGLAMRGVKVGWEIAARALAGISRQRYILAPSIQATARRQVS